ncbi:MAG: hypothetical protein VYC40_06050 [Pseudomonadota bacterium]|nr:hypothetical protein [Pseudomonadota bacterium]
MSDKEETALVIARRNYNPRFNHILLKKYEILKIIEKDKDIISKERMAKQTQS